LTSNISKVSARYKRMAKNLPGVTDKAVRGLITDDAIPQFEKTVRTWTHQPRFTPLRRQRGWAVEVNPIYPYQYVNRGTRVRRALMSSDWVSKTKPNVIASYRGSGRVLFISRKLARPGIKARNFQDIIMRRVQARAANTIREALRQASYGAGMGL
jgi:hypothetical protein